jgi:seryl-tRNA synthetase
MTLLFSQNPGRRERHLLRKRNNSLFSDEEQRISSSDLQEAQRQDHEELVEFITEFRTLIHETVNLQPNEDSGVILEIKERLDRAYEQASGLADDQTETKNAIQKLVQVIMSTVEAGAGDDPQALQELEQEKAARTAHFALLQHPIVADLLCPDSPIAANELAPTLLSESADSLQAALDLFDNVQLAILYEEAQETLKRVEEDGTPITEQRSRLLEMETRLTAAASGLAN